MKNIIIGLGNPGPKYENTYHNIGHIFVDFLANPKKRFKKERFFLYQDREQCLLVKTAVYMNESGSAVKAALRRFASARGALATLMLVHDDSDLSIGNYKLSEGSGAAGHKGVESVIRALGHSNFKRLRIGIRKPEVDVKANMIAGVGPAGRHAPKRAKAGDFVLRNISKSDRETLHWVFEELRRSVIEKVA